MALDRTVLKDMDWESLQQTLETYFNETGCLSSTLDILYDQQCASGFIHQRHHESIDHLHRIRDPQGRFEFILQLNEYRVNRGVASTPHPDPPHMIPYKGGVPCFCCPEVIHYQWPTERGFHMECAGIPFLFLPNMSPLFKKHFTITTFEHTPQRIDLASLIGLSYLLKGEWIIQNGEGAGATNPWHFHYQSFQFELPLHHYISQHRLSLFTTDDMEAYSLHIPKPIFLLTFRRSDDLFINNLQNMLNIFFKSDPDLRHNFLCHFDGDSYYLYIGLRHIHCKTDMYKTGQPGYAEMGGLISVPTQDAYNFWLNDGINLYKTLLSDIALPPHYYHKFLNQLRTIKKI